MKGGLKPKRELAHEEGFAMENMRRVLTVLSFGWIIAGPSAQADIIFDNLRGASHAFFGPGCCQIGDEITLVSCLVCKAAYRTEAEVDCIWG
jgi:hypothetical protein